MHDTHITRATASVAAILAESAARYPDDVAVIVGDVRTTYAELWAQTLAYAGALRARGVTEGSKVAMLVPNVADFPASTTPRWPSARWPCPCTRC